MIPKIIWRGTKKWGEKYRKMKWKWSGNEVQSDVENDVKMS